MQYDFHAPQKKRPSGRIKAVKSNGNFTGSEDLVIEAAEKVRQFYGAEMGNNIDEIAKDIRRGFAPTELWEPFYQMVERGERVPFNDPIWQALIDTQYQRGKGKKV